MGQLLSGGTSRSAISTDLEAYDRMREQQAKQVVPVFQQLDDQHAYLYIALFDGTGQSADNPRQLLTNVGEIRLQASVLQRDQSRRIAVGYVEGIGTQRNPVKRAIDGALPYTWDDRIETAYTRLARQTEKWKHQDPEARISVVGVGYSRGAVLVPGLARLIDTYGIAHPEGLGFGRDRYGNITVESSSLLVPPGEVAQAVGLFDPVGTNLPKNYDARLPKSVLSGFSQIARDEQRELFPHQTILDPDWSADGRFLSATLPGGHSNIGGGNAESGLEVLAFNGMVDYLNALTDQPLFTHRPVPADPAQYTIFQARGATAAFGLRMDHDGQRNLRDELANCKVVDICRDAEPVDLELARRFSWQSVTPVIEQVPPRLPDAPAVVQDVAAPLPDRSLPFDDRSHPDHAMYRTVRDLVHTLDREHGKQPDAQSDNLSAAIVVAARAEGLDRVDRLRLSHDAAYLTAVQSHPGVPERRADVPVVPGVQTPLERSAERWPAAMQAFESRVPERSRAYDGPSAYELAQPMMPPRAAVIAPAKATYDPCDLDEDEHALYVALRERVPDAGPKRLLQFTAACHENGITAGNLDRVYLNEDAMTIEFHGKSWLAVPAVIDLTRASPEPEQSLEQIRTVDRQQMEIDHAIAQSAQLGRQGHVR